MIGPVSRECNRCGLNANVMRYMSELYDMAIDST